MRIVLSNSTFRWGGVQAVTEMLARGLAERGHEIVLFCKPGSMIARRLAPSAACVPILGGMDLHPGVLSRCVRALRRHRPDVAMMMMKKDLRLTGVAARLLRVPVVFRHASDQPLRTGWYHRALYDLVPTLHVANSDSTARTLLGSAPWLHPDRVAVVHNAVHAERFSSAAPADLGLPPGSLAIGFVGRFDLRKGILDLLDAWPSVAESLPHAHLVLVGFGGLETTVRERAAAVPRARFLGYRRDIPEVLRALDLLVVPSHWEGFGLAALEGLAAGVPVVATRASSLPEIVTDGVQGRLVPPEDPRALAQAIVALGRDPDTRARMAAAGRARALEFGPGRMLDRYEELLETVATDRHRSSVHQR